MTKEYTLSEYVLNLGGTQVGAIEKALQKSTLPEEVVVCTGADEFPTDRPFIVLASRWTFEGAVEARRAGALHYATLSASPEELLEEFSERT